jgi:hypothetical protein
MKLSKNLVILAVAFACLLPVMARALPASGHEVSGSYAIQQETDAGTNVQIMLHVRLNNSEDYSLRSSQVALRSIVSDTTQKLDVSIDLPAQGSTDFTQQVTITRSEYVLWQKGARPLLVLDLEGSDGTRITRTIALIPATAEGN